MKVEQLVRGVFVLGEDVELGQEVVVQRHGWRGHVLEIAEDTARQKRREDLLVESAFAFVAEVVNGKAGDQRREFAEVPKRLGKVMRDGGDYR